MNRYEFENLISDYLEGELSFSKIKEFESYLEENEDAKSLFFRVRTTLNDMKNAEKISTTDNFNSKLLSKIIPNIFSAKLTFNKNLYLDLENFTFLSVQFKNSRFRKIFA